MLTQHETQIEGGWTELKGKVNQAWGEVTEDELREFQGNVQELIGLIQRKTGETHQQVAKRLQELDEQFAPMLAQAAETARQYVEQTTEAAREAAAQVRQRFAEGHADAQQMVQRRPLESVAVAFGAGVIAGVVVGLALRSR